MRDTFSVARAIRLRADQCDWLEAHGCIDDGCVVARVRLHAGGPMGWYLRRLGRSAITTGDHVWFRDTERRERLPLIAHELVHVAQFRRRGFARFLLRYWWDMARARFHYSRRLPLEAPAYERQRLVEDLLRSG